MNKKQRKRHLYFSKIVCVLFAFVIILQMNTVTAFSDNDDWERKLSDELGQKIANGEQSISIMITRQSIDSKELSRLFWEENGYSLEDYEDPVHFVNIIIPQIEKTINAQYGSASTVPVEVGNGEYRTPLEVAVLEAINDFRASKRAVASTLCEKSNKDFIARYKLQEYVDYASKYTTIIFATVPVEIIQRIAKDLSVESLDVNDHCEVVPCYDYSMNETNIDDVHNNYQYNNGFGYQGYGTRIGVIEYYANQAVSFDQYNPQLRTIVNTRLFYVGNSSDGAPLTNDHATMVTSLIVGISVWVDGHHYEGAAPNATVYQTSIKSSGADKLDSAIELLLEENVQVINMSISYITLNYSSYDRLVDRIIRDNNVTIVVASGNQGARITSPGLAYNCITVGNASPSIYPVSNQFDIAGTSNWQTYDSRTDKPELVAPGTDITVADNSEDGIMRASGTSFSAPIVAGAVALLIEADPYLSLHPVSLKASLIMGTNHSRLSETEGNTALDPEALCRLKSGFGLLDADASVSFVLEPSGFVSYVWNSHYSQDSAPQYNYSSWIMYESGTRVRVVTTCTVNDPDQSISGHPIANVQITRMISGQEVPIFITSEVYNNTIVVEYVIPETGFYRFEPNITCTQLVLDYDIDVGIAYSIIGGNS